ncbi:efflux transporter outer membrane subunit [Pollutimonas bauzanensis]|uniref:Efflux transporter, outer membrane factor (OMF) lipoprotein, NodT family n=1 Tax=Pollutimonas bauzanensis TaxID=658167 RepID=A0A1M5R639_9BURK|nr:efflux transporter outer membrane subunit [Pollutimonas bauzanensis]SHH21651.1 efflux transporter, outer membrane factor (OMF) lipoprotein, NodT family [Pollutimonas bauzanensis]
MNIPALINFVGRGAGLRPLAACGLLLLGACAVGPDYERPSMDVGAGYKEAMSATQGGAAGGPGPAPAAAPGWLPARPRDAALRGDWWQLFNDPVLDGLMDTLQNSNLGIAQAEAQYRQAQALLQSARSGFFPTVGASASATRSGGGNGGGSSVSVGGNSTDNQYTLSGNVSWEADLWGRVRRTVESSRAGLQASAADVATTRLSMQSTLAQTYFNLRVMDAEQRLLQQTVDAYERSLTMTQNRYQAGVAAQSDVAVSRTQLENTRTQLLALDWQRAQLEHAIAVLLGQTPSSFALNTAQILGTVPVIPVGLPSQLLERRPDVAAAERRAAEANAQIGVAQAAWFPDLTLSAQGGFRSGQWAQWLTAPARFWSLGPALALTLFDGGARQAQVEQARASYDAQAAGYRQTVLTALREVEDYLVQLHVLGQEQVTQGRALASARESLRLTQNQYEAGLIDYLSVVQVETTALSTERAALQLTADRLVASVQLIAALGGGWEAGLAGVDEGAASGQ